MSEMVERVAKAINEANNINDEFHWEGYLPVARAAIEAMREPTQEMEIVAGNQGYIINHYKNMIDAALK